MQKYKSVVVTGAKAGLGLALCEVLIKRGYVVGAIVRDDSSRDIIQAKFSSDTFFCSACDVRNISKVRSSIHEITSKFGQIDAVFNNAAMYPKVNIFDQEESEFQAALDTNITGIINVVRSVSEPMKNQGFGRVINLGSWAHLQPIERAAIYSASKGAVHSLTKALATDSVEKHLPINFIEWIPGHLNTQMSDFTGMDPLIAAGWGADLLEVDLTGKPHSIFEGNVEWQPPKGIKDKLKSKLLFWR